MPHLTARDARTGLQIQGKLLREYTNGVTIEDARGVIHFITFDRVVRRGHRPWLGGIASDNPLDLKGCSAQGDLFND